MPTDSDPACRGGRKRRRVTLKQNVESPYDTGKSIVKGHRGLQEASKRSALLSGIEMTPERANIPGNMTQEDAELWKTACMKGIQPRMEDLVKALKVTPVLGDGKDSRWIDMLANEALATEWSDPETSNNALCSLLDLPSPLLHRVLSACIKTQSLTRVLTAFPPPLHLSTLISSADNGHVDIHHHPSHLLLMLLSSDLFPPPGLRSLRIGEPRHRAVIPTSSAVLIARAVAAHPSLTSLSIRGTLTAAALRKFHACLVPAAPTNLTSISLRDITINGGPPAAAHTLAAFTSLTHVEIYFNSDTSLSPSLRPYARRVFSPTLLPCLHTLKLIEPGLPGSALCQTSEEGSCIPLFLPLIRAPSITCMTVNRLLTSLSIPALQSALSHYTSLQQLNIVADFADPTVQPAQHSTQHEPKCLPRAHHGPHAPHAANAQHAQHAQHDRQSTATLPSLQRLCVKSACPRCYWTTAAAAASLATGSLTRLTAGVITARSGGSSGSGVQRCVRADAHGRDAWRDALRAIGACTKLEHLELTNLGTADSAGSVHEYTGMLAAVLAPLSRLTEISLVAMSRAGATEPCCELRAGPLMASLQQLPHLKALRLGGGGGQMEFDDAAAVVAGCAALTQLTTVSLLCSGVDAPAVEGLLSQKRGVATVVLPEGFRTADVAALQRQFQWCRFSTASSHSHPAGRSNAP